MRHSGGVLRQKASSQRYASYNILLCLATTGETRRTSSLTSLRAIVCTAYRAADNKIFVKIHMEEDDVQGVVQSAFNFHLFSMMIPLMSLY